MWCHQNEQLRELRLSFTSERTFGWYVCDFLGVLTYLIWIPRSWFIQTTNPDSHDGSGDVSHRRTPGYKNALWLEMCEFGEHGENCL